MEATMPVPVVPAVSSDFVLLSHLTLSVYRSMAFLNKQEKKNHFLDSTPATNRIMKDAARSFPGASQAVQVEALWRELQEHAQKGPSTFCLWQIEATENLSCSL